MSRITTSEKKKHTRKDMQLKIPFLIHALSLSRLTRVVVKEVIQAFRSVSETDPVKSPK